jgi:hypothetical protein
MDPFSLVMILAVVGLIAWTIISNRRGKKLTTSENDSSHKSVDQRDSAPGDKQSALSSRDETEPEMTVLIKEVAKVRFAITALVRPLLIWATFQLVAGALIGIGVIIILTDPSEFAEGGSVPIVIGGLINLVGIGVAVSSGWRYLRQSARRI